MEELITASINERFNQLEAKIGAAFAVIEARCDQLERQIQDLAESTENMCGDSRDLAKSRKYALEQSHLYAKSWSDIRHVFEHRGSAASKILMKHIDEELRPMYKAGPLPSKHDLFRLLHDSVFMARVRQDYLQKSRVIVPEAEPK